MSGDGADGADGVGFTGDRISSMRTRSTRCCSALISRTDCDGAVSVVAASALLGLPNCDRNDGLAGVATSGLDDLTDAAAFGLGTSSVQSSLSSS